MKPTHRTSRGYGGNSSHCGDDGDIQEVERQEHIEVKVIKVNPQRAGPRNGFIQDLMPGLRENYVDFEDNDPKFAIKNPENALALSKNELVDNDTFPELMQKVEYKKGIHRSGRSLNGRYEISPQRPLAISATIEENKDFAPCHPPPVPTAQKVRTLVLCDELSPDIYDFSSPVRQPRRSATNGVLKKVNHLNGFPAIVPRQTVSVNGSPWQKSPELTVFATCSDYRLKTQLSPKKGGENGKIPVVCIPRELMLKQSGSVQRFSVSSDSSANKAKLTFKERIQNTGRALIERISGRAQELYCRTIRIWSRIKNEYNIVSDGIRKMNRENR